MSLQYIYNLFEGKTPEEITTKINLILYHAKIYQPCIEVKYLLQNIRGKQSAGKNPYGLLLMELTEHQLEELLPVSILDILMFEEDKYVFCQDDRRIINFVKEAKEAVDTKDYYRIKLILDQLYCNPYYDKAQVFEIFRQGIKKYGDKPSSKNPYTIIPALARHLYKMRYCDIHDEETNCYHINHAICNLIILYHIIRKQTGEKTNA